MRSPFLVVLTTLALFVAALSFIDSVPLARAAGAYPQPARRAAAWPPRRASTKVKRAPQDWWPPAPHPSPQHHAGGSVDANYEDQKNEEKQGRCPESLMACPVRGAHDVDAFECVDPWADLSSCGGCPAYDIVHDCSAIAHARSVECVAGHCEVRLCNEGYVVASQNNECVPARGATYNTTTSST